MSAIESEPPGCPDEAENTSSRIPRRIFAAAVCNDFFVELSIYFSSEIIIFEIAFPVAPDSNLNYSP